MNSAPVPVFLIFTSAPGMTPPDVSTTVPEREVKKLPCANAGAVAVLATIRAASARTSVDLINLSSLRTNRSCK